MTESYREGERVTVAAFVVTVAAFAVAVAAFAGAAVVSSRLVSVGRFRR